MPHINYRRGETRRSVRKTAHRWKNRRWRSYGHRANHGSLMKDYYRASQSASGGGGFRCPCCNPGKEPRARRIQKRCVRIEGRKLCREVL